jgi:hypothetical protein
MSPCFQSNLDSFTHTSVQGKSVAHGKKKSRKLVKVEEFPPPETGIHVCELLAFLFSN